jgi:hypothetical protein
MKFQSLLQGFLLVAPVSFATSVVVSYLYTLFVHGAGVADWEGSLRFGIIFGIVLPVVQAYGKKK